MFRTVGVTQETVSAESARTGRALGALSSMSGQSKHFEDQTEIFIYNIIFRCPSLSSARWCYRLYSIILASLGLLLSFLWVSWETNLNKSCPRTFSALVFMVVECLAMQSYPLDQGQWPLFFFVERLTMCKCTS